MKSTISQKPYEAEIKYPCLMVHEDGNVYKMFDEDKGFLVYEKEPLSSVDQKTGISNLRIFHGSVCLEND